MAKQNRRRNNKPQTCCDKPLCNTGIKTFYSKALLVLLKSNFSRQVYIPTEGILGISLIPIVSLLTCLKFQRKNMIIKDNRLKDRLCNFPLKKNRKATNGGQNIQNYLLSFMNTTTTDVNSCVPVG